MACPPSHPTTCHAALSTAWLVGSWGAVLKRELCLLYLFVWKDWVHPDLKSIPTPLSEAGMKCGQFGLQIPKMFQHWFPSPNFPPYTFGWKTEGIYISSLSPSTTRVASVNTLSRFLWSLQSRGQSSSTSSIRLGWSPSGDQGPRVCHQDQWGEERTTLREQKLCALFCLLPCLLVCLFIYVPVPHCLNSSCFIAYFEIIHGKFSTIVLQNDLQYSPLWVLESINQDWGDVLWGFWF